MIALSSTSPLTLVVLFVLAAAVLSVAGWLEHRRRRVDFDEKWSAFVDAMRGIR